MVGSDWPVCTLAAGYDKVLSVVNAYSRRFSTDERDALFGKNAARFYRLAE